MVKQVTGWSLVVILTHFGLVNGETNETSILKNATQLEIGIFTGNTTSFCDQIDKCQESVKIPEEYNDLRTRSCMCDEKCAVYNDCCSDSTYANNSNASEIKFDCLKTTSDGYIYMISSCPANWTGVKTILDNCKISTNLSSYDDVVLLSPVTNPKTNLTYKNIFCAVCNDEQYYKFWNILLECNLQNEQIQFENISSSINNTNYDVENIINKELLLSKLKLFKNQTSLISEFNNLTYKCEMRSKLPQYLANSIRYCYLREKNTEKCTTCNGQCNSNITKQQFNTFEVEATNKYLPRGDYCNIINSSEICSTVPSTPTTTRPPTTTTQAPEKYIDSCFYKTIDGRDCLVNSFFKKGTDYSQVSNETVHIFTYDADFPWSEWDYQDENTIYVCGTEIPMTKQQKFVKKLNDYITEVLIKFSIFFLILYISTSFQGTQLQSLANKIILSYCITLLGVYSTFEIAQWSSSCKIASAVLHYLFLCCFNWLLVASYDFWLVVCKTSAKFQSLAGKTRLKRYLVYCFIGWISPMFIMAVAIYFELSPVSKISCYWKPGYGRLKQCFIAQRTPSYYFFFIPITVVFCTNIYLFLQTSLHIFMSKRKGIKSTAQNNYYSLFTKLALTMGMTWTLGMFVTYTNFLIFQIIYCILNASQGIFMYFAFGFDKKIINKFFQDHKDNSVFQQTKSTYLAFTDIIKGKSSVSTSSTAERSTQIE